MDGWYSGCTYWCIAACVEMSSLLLSRFLTRTTTLHDYHREIVDGNYDDDGDDDDDDDDHDSI